MGRDEIIAMTKELAQAERPFVLATTDQEGRPQMRWMGGCVIDDPLTFWMAAGAKSRKMGQIRGNPAGQLMFQDEQYGRVATVTGECEIVEDIEAKRRLWERMPQLSRYVSGPEDPEFGVIKLIAKHVEALNMAEGMGSQVAEL